MATNGSDTLSTSADGETLAGLAGNDILNSSHNATTLLGDAGDDALTTAVNFGAEEPVDASATQRGGTGEDRLSASIGVSAGSASIVLAGDDGNDELEARAYISEATFITPILLQTDAAGGAGHDIIDVEADLNGGSDGTALNLVSGGAGDDQITAFARTFFYGFDSIARNVIDGDDGNDVIDATAVGFSNGGDLASNLLAGGAGDDFVRGSVISDSNSSEAVGVNQLSGGDGNDTLEATHDTDGENLRTDVTSELDGGAGNDTLVANSVALTDLGLAIAHHDLLGWSGDDMLTSVILAEGSLFDVSATLAGGAGADTLDSQVQVSADHLSDSGLSNSLDGGAENDTLHASLSLQFASWDGATNAVNHLLGGEGDDHLSAHLTVAVEDSFENLPLFYQLGTNELFGGDGNDIMSASIETSTQSALTTIAGSSFLDGGAGNDHLTVAGGTDNVLVGGSGNDTMVAGVGSDQFVFEFVVEQATPATTLFFRPNKAGDAGLTPGANASRQAWAIYLQQLEDWREDMLLYGQDQNPSSRDEALYKWKKTTGSLGTFDNSYTLAGSPAVVSGEGTDTIIGWGEGDTLQLIGLADLSFSQFDEAFDVQLDQDGDTLLSWTGGALAIDGLSLGNVQDFYSAGLANDWFHS